MRACARLDLFIDDVLKIVTMERLKCKRTEAMERLSVEGIEAVLQAAEERQSSSGGVFILFCGSVQPDSGESWCPDCIRGNIRRYFRFSY